MTTNPDSAADRTTLAAEAYIYGFATLFNLDEVSNLLTDGLGPIGPKPFNEFANGAALAGADTKFVSVNNDTVYSLANIDTSGGPVRFDVPAADDRYYVMQFVDVWTENFAYVGRRATGTGAGSFLLVAPDWAGTAPADTTVIRFPNTVATIVGRWAVDGESDLPAVAELQAGLRLTPTGAGVGLPKSASGVPEDLEFFEKLRVAMRAFPPAERDRVYQQRFAPLGLLDAESPYVDADPALAKALREGIEAGRKQLEAAMADNSVPVQNGWRLIYHLFDYNIDFFQVGTIDEPEWKVPDTPARYLQRAVSARAGLWGNHGYEAAYPMTNVDGDGQLLDGAHRYEIRFATPPPCAAFWSVTMYDTPDFYLVDNPINRYSIGDRTPGLRTGSDGSLTLTIQHDEPTDPDRRANWLPAPTGTFRPVLRIYQPHPTLFDGSYQIPPIVRID